MLLLAPAAWSAGLGGNFSYSRSNGDVEHDDDLFLDIGTRADHFEFGISFDTNLARDRLFNYRINANVQIVDQKLNQGPTKVDIQGAGFAINQLFGFGIVRRPGMRLFIGPTLHLGYANFDDDDRVGPFLVDYEEDLVTFGLGPEVGINFHPARHLTISITGFYRYGLQVQGFDSPFSFVDPHGDNQYFVGSEHRVGLTTAIFFRFEGDQYR
ncbi:MAG TPA: hypothetical protein ENI85_12395 [Deltaproteobacteria bacterium]|nr:hypothetical protein [Deltaproteobacteria bacterium]